MFIKIIPYVWEKVKVFGEILIYFKVGRRRGNIDKICGICYTKRNKSNQPHNFAQILERWTRSKAKLQG